MFTWSDTWLKETAGLLTLAGLPLIDGFFLIYFQNPSNRNTWRAITFGLIGFSGAGCFVRALTFSGNWPERFLRTLLVYVIVGTGTVLASKFHSLWVRFVGLTWNPFTGVYLVGLGISISKLVPDQVISRWTGYDSIPKVLALALIVESILWSITGGHNHVSANGLSIKLGTLGVASGFTLSVCGMMIGLMPNLVKFNQAPLRVLAGGSLALVGIQVFGTRVNPGLFEKPVYALVPVVAVLIGLVLGFVH